MRRNNTFKLINFLKSLGKPIDHKVVKAYLQLSILNKEVGKVFPI